MTWKLPFFLGPQQYIRCWPSLEIVTFSYFVGSFSNKEEKQKKKHLGRVNYENNWVAFENYAITLEGKVIDWKAFEFFSCACKVLKCVWAGLHIISNNFLPSSEEVRLIARIGFKYLKLQTFLRNFWRPTKLPTSTPCVLIVHYLLSNRPCFKNKQKRSFSRKSSAFSFPPRMSMGFEKERPLRDQKYTVIQR